jgi:hypothetical protein
MEELDEFGIPIKKTSTPQSAKIEMDEFGIPLKKKEPSKNFYEVTSEAIGIKPKQLSQSPLKTAATTTPSVSTKSALQGIKGTSTPPTGVTKIKTTGLPSESNPYKDQLQKKIEILNQKFGTDYDVEGALAEVDAPDIGTAEAAGRGFLSGVNNIFAAALYTPEYLRRIFTNPIMELAGMSEEDKQLFYGAQANNPYDPLFVTNKLSEYYKGDAEKITKPLKGQFDKDFLKQYEEGDYIGAAKQFGVDLAQSIPATIGIAAATAAGVPQVALMPVGSLVFASQNYQDIDPNSPMTETAKQTNSFLKGFAEQLFENLGTSKLTKQAMALIEREGVDNARAILAKQYASAAKEALKPYFPLTAPLQEGLTEGGTAMAQNVIDMLTDPSKKNINIMDNVVKSTIMGTGMGVAFGGAPTVINTALSLSGKKKAKEIGDKLAEIDKDLDNEKLSDQVKGLLVEERAKSLVDINNVLEAENNKFNELPEEVKTQVQDIQQEISAIEEALNSEITETAKQSLEAKKNELTTGLDNLIKTGATTTDGKGTTKGAVSTGTNVAQEGLGVATEPGSEGVTGEDIQAEKVLKPTQDQILSDVQSGNVVTFEYKSENEIPDSLKDKVSSVITSNGKKVYRVTLSKSEADFLLQEGKQQAEAVPQAPVLEVETPSINLAVPENPYNKALRNLGYADADIEKMTIEQKQNIAENKIEAPVVESTAKVDSIKENAKQERIAEMQAELDQETPLEEQQVPEVVSEKVTEVTAPAIEVTPTAEAKTTTKPVAERIADLRAAEKAEYDAMADPKDKAKRKEIYDKYDKLITPLIAEQKADIERTINNLPDNLLFITHITSEGNAINIYNNNLLMPAGVSSTTGIVSKEKLKQILFDLAEGKSPHRGYLDMFIGAIDRTVLENTPGKSLQTKLENYLDENFIEDVAKTQLPSSLNIGYFTNGVLNTKYDTGLTALKKPKSETKATEAATAEPVKEPAKPEAKKSKPEQIGEGLLDLLGLAPEGEESTGTEFQDGVKPQFKVDLNENLSEEQADEVKKIFDEVLDNPNASNSEVINIDDTIDPSIPTQQITISPTDKRPEAGLMSKLRVPLDFIFGKSVGLGMSDTLTTGERTVDVMNPKTGKIDQKTIREEGGIGYPFKSLMDLMNGKIPKGGKIFGWASVGEGAGTAMINAAKKANKITGLELKKQYFNNLNLTEEQKQRINDAIPDNKEYGLVSIYKMGNDGILSNEAHTREAFRQIETSLNESEKELFFKLAKERLTSIKWEGKEDYISLINSANNFVELENILHGKDSKLPLGAKASIVQNVFLSTEKTVSTETGNKLGELLKSKGISIESVSRAIEEPAMKGIDKGQPMLLLAIDPDSKVIEDVNRERHNNYPYGVEGFPIGVFNETTQMHRISPEMMDNFVKTATTTVDENAKKDGKNVRVSIYQAANGNFYAQEGKGVKKFSVKDKKGNNLFGTSKEELLNKLKKEGYKLSESTVKERYTQKINGTTFNNLLQKAKTGFISIFNNPKLSAQEKLVKYLQKAFPGISVEVNLNEYKKLEDDFRAQKLFNKDGKSYGFVKDGRVYLNPEYLNNNTPIHEFGHVWNSFAKNYKPEIYAKGVELVNNSKYQSFVLNDAQYQKLIKAEFGADAIVKDKATGKFIVNENSKNAKEIKDAVADEALAKAIGDKGELFVNEAQKRSFANWLNKLFDAIKQLAGFESMTPEQFQNLSLNQFVDAAVKEILSGKKVSDITSTELSKMTKTSAKFSLESQKDKIKNFIEGQRKAGQSDKDIKAGLELVADKVGLTPEDINNLMGVESDEAKPTKGYTPKKKLRRMAERIIFQGKEVPESIAYYTPTTIDAADAKAKELLDELGIDDLVKLISENPEWISIEFFPRVARAAILEINKEQDDIQSKLKKTEDKNLSKRLETLSDMKMMVYGKALPISSRAGLSLSMWKDFSEGIPFDHVREVQRIFELSNEKTKNTFIDVLNKLNLINDNVIEQVAAKIASTVGKSKVEKAKANYESSKRSLKDVWNRSKNVGIAETPWERARKNLQFDKALAKAAKDFVIYKSVQFSQFIKEVSDMLGIAESDIDKDHLKGIFDKVKETQIQKGIKGALSDMEMSLKDLIVDHFTELQETEKSLVDKLKESFGLEEADAQEVANEVSKELRKLSTQAKVKAIKASGLSQGKWVDELLTLSESGSLDFKDIRDEFAKKIGLRELTDEQMKKLEGLAIEMRDEKDPRKKVSLAQDLEDYKHALKTRYGLLDFLVSDYLTNIFASIGSNIVNFVSNFMETTGLLGEVLFKSVGKGNFKDVPLALTQFVKGTERGLGFTKQVILEGKTTYKPVGELAPRGIFEILYLRPDEDLNKYEKFAKAVLRMKFVGAYTNFHYKFWNRLLLSMDSLSGVTNTELGALYKAIKDADKLGLKGQERSTFLNKELGMSTSVLRNAVSTAKELGYEKGYKDYERVVQDLIIEGRSEETKEYSKNYSKLSTLTQEPPPSTMVGAMAAGINSVAKKYKATKFIFPVVNTFANLIIKSIERSPFEFISLGADAMRVKTGNLSQEALSDEEIKRRFKAATVATVAGVALLLMAGGADDEERDFDIFGSGTGDKDLDALLKSKGWKPYSIKFSKNSGYWSFEYTPIGLLLGLVGDLRDLARYKSEEHARLKQMISKKMYKKNYDELDENEKLDVFNEAMSGEYKLDDKYSTKLVKIALTPVRLTGELIKSVGAISKIMSGDVDEGVKYLASTGRGILSPRYGGEIKDMFDNKLYDTKAAWTVLTSNMPFVEVGDVKLDGFGREITKYDREEGAAGLLQGLKYTFTRRVYNPSRVNEIDIFLAKSMVKVNPPSNDLFYTDEKYIEYQVLRGSIAMEKIKAEMDKGTFEDLSPMSIKNKIDEILTKANKKAKKEINETVFRNIK